MLVSTTKFLRQIFPPVVATLIAALLIAGFNRAFSTHLSQPRMAAMNSGAATEEERPRARPISAMTEVKPAVFAEAFDDGPAVRQWDKGAEREAAKDAGAKLAEAAPLAAPAPAQAAVPATAPAPAAQPQTAGLEAARAALRKAEPRQAEARHIEARPAEPRVAAAPPPAAQPHPMAVPASPPPVIVAAPAASGTPAGNPNEAPMVTVPDRPRALSQAQPQYPADPQYGEAQAQQPGPPRGPIGTFVNAMKPSNWFARAREFGEHIEAMGNDILPTIRQ
jgi:hypothetical protein